MARGLNAHGVAVGVAGYDLAPEVTIAEIIEQIRHACLFMWLRTGQRMMVYGHSAGGHLAAAMVATEWHELYPKTPADLVPAAYSVSGVFDLTPLVQVTMAQDLRARRGRGARGVSPLFWPAPKGRVFDAVVGGLEFERVLAPEPGHRRELGARPASQTRFEAIAGANHFTSIDTMPDPQSAMVGRLVELAQKASEPVAPGKDRRQQARRTNTTSVRAAWFGIDLRQPRADEAADQRRPPS